MKEIFPTAIAFFSIISLQAQENKHVTKGKVTCFENDISISYHKREGAERFNCYFYKAPKKYWGTKDQGLDAVPLSAEEAKIKFHKFKKEFDGAND